MYVVFAYSMKGSILRKGKCQCPDQGNFGMLLCRVALGDVHIAKKYDSATYKGDPTNPVRRPPAKLKKSASDSSVDQIANNNNHVNHVHAFQLYDSVLGESKAHGGDLLNYREFIVYDR